MKKILLIVFLFASISFANFEEFHQDIYVIQEYGNVKTRICTGFQCEEIRKVEIIGKYAKLLADKRNFTKPILLDFVYHYTGDCDPDSFISIGNGLVRYKRDRKRKAPLASEGTVIRQIAHQFDIAETLQLLDYAMIHQEDIKVHQQFIQYKKNYQDNVITSLDTSKVNVVLNQKRSDFVNEVLKKKVWRYAKDNKRFSVPKYYAQNNKFYIQYSINRKLKLLELDHIHDFQVINNTSALIFDTQNSFYYQNRLDTKRVLKKTVIKNLPNHYRPFMVKGIGKYKVAISTNRFSHTEERVMIYDGITQKLIQDLDQEFQD